MCISLPGRVVALDAGGATVEVDGQRRRATTLLLPDLAVGDWVVVLMGTVVERLADDEAREVTEALHVALALADDNADPDAPAPVLIAAG